MSADRDRANDNSPVDPPVDPPVPDIFDVDDFLGDAPRTPPPAVVRPRLRDWDGSCEELAEFSRVHDRMPHVDERLPDGYALGRWMQAAMTQYRPTVEEREATLPTLAAHANPHDRAARARHLREYADRRARLVAIPHFRFATPERGPVDWVAVLRAFTHEHHRAPVRYERYDGLGLGDYYKRLRAAYRSAQAMEATRDQPLSERDWALIGANHKVHLDPTVIAAVASLRLDLGATRPERSLPAPPPATPPAAPQ